MDHAGPGPDKLVVEMDSLKMAVMVNLSGFRGKLLEWSLENVRNTRPNGCRLYEYQSKILTMRAGPMKH